MSFFRRITLQVPSVIFSVLTVILISRHLGPDGRGELTIFFLSTTMVSTILSTSSFLDVMNAKKLDQLNSIILNLERDKRLEKFAGSMVGALGYLIFGLLLQYDFSFLVLSVIIIVNILYIQVNLFRDYCIKTVNPYVYLVDSVIQGCLFLSTLIITLLYGITLVTYSLIFCSFLFIHYLVLSKLAHQVLTLQIGTITNQNGVNEKFRGRGIAEGFLQQILLSKDLILGSIFLSQVTLGTMSAAASFWVSIRFLKSTTFIHQSVTVPNSLRYDKVASGIIRHPLFVQCLLIFTLACIGYFSITFVLGEGFQLEFKYFVIGALAEALLMIVLYLLSFDRSKGVNQFLVLIILGQGIVTLLLKVVLNLDGINVIWVTSVAAYVLIITFLLSRKSKRGFSQDSKIQ